MTGIPRRKLGSTGRDVSIIGLGGAHIARAGSRKHAIDFVREAIDRGIDFMDNCWSYHDGNSEIWMGEALKDGYRDRVFLMTKIDGRVHDAAEEQLDQSLHRLQTDYIDLVQIHEVIRWADPEQAFEPGAVMDVLIKAKKSGKIGFIGFTGHKDPGIHLKMLDHDFQWDTVQMPVNLLDAGFNSFQKQVLPVLNVRGIGVLGMKPMAAGALLDTGAVSGVEALQYAMSLPVDVVITGMETKRDLDQAIEAASTLSLLSDRDIRKLLERVAPFSRRGEYEDYKNTNTYDGTARHPEWLVTSKIK